jgi:AcrR family transcriptional regulator
VHFADKGEHVAESAAKDGQPRQRQNGSEQFEPAVEELPCAALPLGGVVNPEQGEQQVGGERAGVTRGAPYGHFESKGHLLTVLAVAQWHSLRDYLAGVTTSQVNPSTRLRQAVAAIVQLGTEHRPTYELMFTVPDEHPELVAEAVAQAQDLFIAMVGEIVGDTRAQRTAALIMAGAHGIAGLAANNHLRTQKWGIEASDLVGASLRPSQRTAADRESDPRFALSTHAATSPGVVHRALRLGRTSLTPVAYGVPCRLPGRARVDVEDCRSPPHRSAPLRTAPPGAQDQPVANPAR